MTTNELAEAWPDCAGTHNITDTELARIAKAATCVEQANAIWENESWWADPEDQALTGLTAALASDYQYP